MPGETQHIDVVYRCGSRTSDESQQIRITFHEPDAPSIEVSLRAKVREPVAVVPAEVLVEQAATGRSGERVVRILNHTDMDWTRVDIHSESDWLSGTAHEVPRMNAPARTSGSPRQEWRGIIKFLGPSAGRHHGVVYIRAYTDTGTSASTTIPVQLTAVAPATAIPQQIFFGSVRPSTTVTRQVIVRFARDAARVHATEARCTHTLDQELHIGIEAKDNYWLLTARLTPAASRSGAISGSLSIEFPPDSDLPAITLPIIGQVVNGNET